MTGFGDASEQIDGIHYVVELRSLNSRYFKAAVRLPEELAGLESELEAQLRQRVKRGSVSLTVRVSSFEATAAHRVNDEVLISYLDHIRTLHSRVSSEKQTVNIDLTALLALPGVLQPVEDEQARLDRVRPVIARLIDQAHQKLLAMRDTEGQAIAQDLAKQRELIRTKLDEIGQRAPQVSEEYHQRLRSRIDELLARATLEVKEQDLIREVAIFAERADISEEVSRMGGHLDQFEQIIGHGDGQPAGRTLDFLTQEMLREANTIGSKSNDAAITRLIVEVKGAIDRIKEQVQNVE